MADRLKVVGAVILMPFVVALIPIWGILFIFTGTFMVNNYMEWLGDLILKTED